MSKVFWVFGFLIVLIGAFFVWNPNSLSKCNRQNTDQEKISVSDQFYNFPPRTLGFTEWGPSDGFPVFHFHPMPGSRLFVHSKMEQMARDNHLRIFVIERPSIGISDPWPFATRSALDWAKDVLQVVDQLELEKVAVIGHSAGCPHALAFSYLLLLKNKLAGVSMMGPIVFLSALSPEDKKKAEVDFSFNQSVAMEGMRSENQIFYFLGASGYHSISRFLLKLFAPILTFKLDQLVDDLLQIESEKIIFNDSSSSSNWREIFINSTAESYSQGVEGLIQDLEACSKPLGFSLKELSKIPVNIWVGSDDHFTPPSHSKLLNELIPNSKLHMIENRGHWSLFTQHYQEVLENLSDSIQEH